MNPIPKIILLILFCFTVNFTYSQFQSQDLEFGTPQKIDSFTGQRASHESIVINNYLYILGGYLWANNKGTIYKDVQYAYLGNNVATSTLKWKKTTDMNQPRTGLAVAAHNGFIYALGGSDENFQPLKSVEYGKLNGDGTISNWKISPSQLILPRSNLSAGIFINKNGQAYLYAIAGVAQIGDQTVHFPSIEFAQINNDGSIGNWAILPYNMKGGRSTPASIIYKSKLFIIGGWGDLLFDDIFSDIQYTDLDDNGLIEPWHTSPYALKTHSYGHYSVVAEIEKKAYIIVTGGSLGQGNTVDFIQYSPIDSASGMNPWIIASNRINGKRWGHSAAYSSGHLYILGGADGSTFMNDVQVVSVKKISKSY